MVLKPKWFRCGEDPSQLSAREEFVTIGNGDAIDQSMNDDGIVESYHVSHTGDIESGENLRYGNQREEFKSHKRHQTRSSELEEVSANSVSADSGRFMQRNRPVGCLVREHDYLDTTFDSIERFTCKEPTGQAFPFATRPPSPPPRKENEHDCLDRTFDRVESYACKEPTGQAFPFGKERPPSPIALVEYHLDPPLNKLPDESDSDLPKNGTSDNGTASLSTTLNTTIDSDLERSDNTCESCFCPKAAIHEEEHKAEFHSNLENSLDDEERQNRLEELRKSKRAIENARLSQTIVIPRSYLYKSEHEYIEGQKCCRSIAKLQIGSSVTNNQAEKYYCRRKLAISATILLILAGVVVLAIGIFWPDRIL